MFTGLIETTGTLLSRQPTGGALRLQIAALMFNGRWKQGDSIAVNGVCLTAIPVPGDPASFAADLASETVQRTTLAQVAAGATVNLELPTPAGAPLGGHVVQGHVDGFVVQQGSITLDGISLTVARLHPPDADGNTQIEVAVIPHTYRSTHLHTLTPGAKLNVEGDVLAKYTRQRAAPWLRDSKAEWLTAPYLLANGY
jgi:riboflavin synthase